VCDSTSRTQALTRAALPSRGSTVALLHRRHVCHKTSVVQVIDNSDVFRQWFK
jgi:hypothetical protein